MEGVPPAVPVTTGGRSVVQRRVLALFGGPQLSYARAPSVRLRPSGCRQRVFLRGGGGGGAQRGGVGCPTPWCAPRARPRLLVGRSRGPFSPGWRHQPGGNGCWGLAARATPSLSRGGISWWCA